MTKIFEESFDNFALRDTKTDAFWNILDGNLQASYETLGLTKRIQTLSNTVVGPSTFDTKRDLLYFVKYLQSPEPHIAIARFDLVRRRFLSDIVLNIQETIDNITVSPNANTLFLISTSGNRVRRVNLETLGEIQNPIILTRPRKIIFHPARDLAF